MEEMIKEIISKFEGLDPILLKRLENAIGRNEAIPAIFRQGQDSFGEWYEVECPSCGEIMKFQRYSQIMFPHNYCYQCGQKLLKQKENE